MQTTYKDFQLKATYKGLKVSPHPEIKEFIPHYKITVKTNQGRTSFDFWGSINDGQQGKTNLNEQELLFAFRCFIEGVISSQESFTDFCDNYGYDNNSLKAYEFWQACKKAAQKLARIWNGDLYALINQMSGDNIEAFLIEFFQLFLILRRY